MTRAAPNLLTVKRISTATTPEALRKTIQLIGEATKSGSEYVPIRQYAGALASQAGPRDFLGQVKKIYDDFTRNRWRYVYDPVGVELLATTGPIIYDTILGFGQTAPARGFGDCDDATVGLSAVLNSIGLQTRTVTISKPGSRKLFDHVFPQVKVPKHGWISIDAVGYPKHPMGWTAPHGRYAIWDTDGNLRGFGGDFPGIIKEDFEAMASATLGSLETEVDTMSFAGCGPEQYRDYGLENFGLAGTDDEEPADWSTYGLTDFGAYTDRPIPILGYDQCGLVMEYDDDDTVGFDGNEPLVRTKMLEMDPKELVHVYRTGKPRLGAVALADDGDVYQWTEVEGLGGFFKKLFKKAKKAVKKVVGKVKKGVRKVVKGITKGAKKLIKKLPGGKYLIKVYDKVKKVAMKIAKPLLKIIGPIAKKLAPIVALFPGYGPVIAAAMYKVGKIDKILKKYGVLRDKKGRPKFKSGKQAKAVTKALKKAAEAQKRKGKGKGKRGRRGERKAVRSGRLLKRGSRRHSRKMAGFGLGGSA